eukprot:gene19001-biopygen50354
MCNSGSVRIRKDVADKCNTGDKYLRLTGVEIFACTTQAPTVSPTCGRVQLDGHDVAFSAGSSITDDSSALNAQTGVAWRGSGDANSYVNMDTIELAGLSSFSVGVWLNLDDADTDVAFFSYGRYANCGFMCQLRIQYATKDIHCRARAGSAGSLEVYNSNTGVVQPSEFVGLWRFWRLVMFSKWGPGYSITIDEIQFGSDDWRSCPTPSPTLLPTSSFSPTASPTFAPIEQPTAAPSATPTAEGATTPPLRVPTRAPTRAPTPSHRTVGGGRGYGRGRDASPDAAAVRAADAGADARRKAQPDPSLCGPSRASVLHLPARRGSRRGRRPVLGADACPQRLPHRRGCRANPCTRGKGAGIRRGLLEEHPSCPRRRCPRAPASPTSSPAHRDGTLLRSPLSSIVRSLPLVHYSVPRCLPSYAPCPWYITPFPAASYAPCPCGADAWDVTRDVCWGERCTHNASAAGRAIPFPILPLLLNGIALPGPNVRVVAAGGGTAEFAGHGRPPAPAPATQWAVGHGTTHSVGPVRPPEEECEGLPGVSAEGGGQG